MSRAIVVGESWCGFSRKQADELALQYEAGTLQQEEVSMCMQDADYTAPNGIVFPECTEAHSGVSAFPTWKLESGVDQPGYKTKEQIDSMMHPH